MATVGSADVEINADVVPMLRQIRRALRGVKGVVEIDTRSAEAALRRTTRESDRVQTALQRVTRAGSAAIRALGRFGSNVAEGVGNAVTSIGSMAAQWIALTAVIGAATLAAARFVAAVGPGVLAVAVGAIAALAAGVALAIPAFQNFIPALQGSADALAKLAPAARNAVNSIRSLGTAFDDIQLEAQATAFNGISDLVNTLRDNLQTLDPQVLSVSRALNTAMVGALNAVNGRFFDVQSIAESAAITFGKLSRAIQPLVEGLLAIAAAGARIAASFSDEVAARLERAGNAMTAFADAGGVERSIARLTAAFSDLGGVARGLEEIFDGVLVLAQRFAEGFGQTFAGTGDVETTLTQIGQSLKDFGPAAEDFGAAIGNVAKGFQQLRPFIVPIVENLADLLRIVTSINGAGVLVALSLILNRLGVSFATQRTAITRFVTAMRTIVSAAGRARVISVLGTIIRGVAAAVAALVAAVGGLAAAAIVIAALAAAFVAALIIFPEFRQKVLEVVQAIGGTLVDAFNAVVSFFQQLPGRVIGFIAPFVTQVIAFFQQLPARILNAIVTLPGLLIEFFLTGLGIVLAAIITGVGEIIVFFLELPGRILEAVSSLVGLLLEFFSTTFEVVKSAITTGIDAVIAFFTALPGRAVAAIQSLPGLLTGIATSALSSFRGAVSSGIDQTLGVIQRVPGQIAQIFSKLTDIMFQTGKNIIKGLIRGIEAMVGEVGKAINKVTKKIADALPGSPVKEGPLSGFHQPWMLGEKVSDMIATGIRAGVPAVRRATAEVARSASIPIAGANGMGTGPSVTRSSTNNTNVSVNVVTAATDNNALAEILQRRLIFGGA